jgi:hypothetical protein
MLRSKLADIGVGEGVGARVGDVLVVALASLAQVLGQVDSSKAIIRSSTLANSLANVK